MPTYTATVYRELMQHTRSEVKIEAATDAEANDKLRMMVGKLRWTEVGWWIIPQQEQFDEVDGEQRPWVTPDPQP